MKKRGFTLIELLAVIVILAIIALIAVPIVLHIIEDSKKSSQKESINMYGKAVEDAAASYLLKNPNDNDITFDKIKDYINYSSGEKIECTDTKIYTNGKIYLGECSIGGTEVEYTYGEKEKTLCTLAEDTGETGLSIGDKYTCEVIKGMEEPYTFYVLTEPQDGKVNLIMNSNICNDGTPADKEHQCNYAWHWQTQEWDEDDNRYGPDIAMTNLYNATKMWNNVPDMLMNYEDENNSNDDTLGYKTIITDEITKVTTITGKQNKTSQYQTFGNIAQPLKARLPRKDEVISQEAGCIKDTNGTCSTWLIENLKYYNVSSYESSGNTDKYFINNGNGITNIRGYWLLTSSSDSSFSYYVDRGGRVRDGNVCTSQANFNGVRAVITVSMSDLS